MKNERPKVNGVIRNRIRRAFELLLKDSNIVAFARMIADVADSSVRSQYTANIMWAAINEEGKWYAEQKKEAEKNQSKDTSENQKENGR